MKGCNKLMAQDDISKEDVVSLPTKSQRILTILDNKKDENQKEPNTLHSAIFGMTIQLPKKERG